MEKRGKNIILGTLLVLTMLVSLAHISYLIIHNNFENNRSPSGQVIGNEESVLDAYISLSPVSRAIISIEWIAVLIITLIILIKMLKEKINLNKDITAQGLPPEIEKEFSYGKSRTDLDLLLKILQKRKVLRLSVITEMFKINREVAMEWCRILEDGNLATIRYPTFGDPRIYISEEEKKGNVNEEKRK